MPTALNIPKILTRGNWQTLYYRPTAAQTYVPGDFVYLDSSGTLAIAAAASNDVGNLEILGISAHDAADVLALPSTPIERRLGAVMVPADNTAQFLTAVYHSTGASAVIAETDLDGQLTLPLRNQAGLWVVNLENDGTNDRCLVVERHDRYAWSTQYGWFWVNLMPAGTWVHVQ